jgi:hypothetical protein
MISVDGSKPAPTPVVAEVKPGKHVVRVTADGYFPDEREVPASAGITTPVDVPLQEMPASLEIKAIRGAEVSVDGRPRGTVPFLKPLEVPSGRHLVAITLNGHRAHAEEIEVGRGEKRQIDARLDSTPQRKASYALMGVGAAGLATGGVLIGMALLEQHKAETIINKASGLGCAPTDASCSFAAYSDARNARDDDRRWAGVAAGAGVVIGVSGLLLYAFDQPTVGAANVRSDKPKAAPEPAAPPAMPMDMAAAPVIGPGLYGAALSGRF